MKGIVKNIFGKFGYLIIKAPPGINNNSNSFDKVVAEYSKQNLKFKTINDAVKDYEVVRKNTMVPFDNLASLYEQVHYLETAGIEGDFVECGVWKGGSVGMMALANLKFGEKRRHLHLFDAFQDICEPDPGVDGEKALKEAGQYAKKDLQTISGKLQPMKGFYDFLGGHGTIEECRSLLHDKIKYPEENIHFYEGWFQETFPVFVKEINEIALLRLDGDWYESTKLSLEFFYDKVISGGIIIIDDYGTYQGCKKAVDDFFHKRNLKKFLMNASSLNGDCFFFIK